VCLVGASQAADDRALDPARDRLDRFEIAGRGDREAGLDHVDAEPGELMRDLDLLGSVERDPGRLLAVSQGRIEDVDAVCVCWCHRTYLLLALTRMTFSLAAHAPPSAIPPEGGGEGEARGCRAGASFADQLSARPAGRINLSPCPARRGSRWSRWVSA